MTDEAKVDAAAGDAYEAWRSRRHEAAAWPEWKYAKNSHLGGLWRSIARAAIEAAERYDAERLESRRERNDASAREAE